LSEQTIAAHAREEKSKLRKVMGPRDLVLFYVACIVAMRVVALSTENGPSVLGLWVLGFVLFFIPQAFTTVELTSRYPDEGGIYVWVQSAFGDFHGFITAWFYWATILVYFPGALTFSASNAAYVIPRWSYLADSPAFLTVASLVGLSIVVVVNVRGLHIAKYLHNAAGYLNLWVPGLMVVGLGFLTWVNYGSATEFSPSTVIPTFGGLSDVVLLAAVAYAYSGLEGASVMSEEVQDPRRNVPRALALAGVLVLGVFVLLSWTILTVLPADQVAGLTALADTARVGGTKLIGDTAGGVFTCARMPFVAGLDRYVPAAFGTLHPTYATPHVSIIMLGILTAGLIILGGMGGTARQIYRIFISLEIIVYFIPYLYMFAALIVMQRRPVAAGVRRAPFAPYGAYLAGGTGFVVTAASLVFALIPGESVADPTFFYITVFGTLTVLTIIGVSLYATGKLRRQRLEAANHE